MSYAFCTLSIGDIYRYKCRTLIDCVLNLTAADLVIVTDCITELQDYVNISNAKNAKRVSIIDVRSISNEEFFYGPRRFNFNLKRLPIDQTIKMKKYDCIFFTDCDVLMIGWDEDSVTRFRQNREIYGFIARLRNKPSDELSLHKMLSEKATGLGISLDSVNAPLPIECIVCFKPNDNVDMFDSFLCHWKTITELAYINGVDPFIEALELAYALDKGQIKTQHINNYYADYRFISTFRLLHADKIIYGI